MQVCFGSTDGSMLTIEHHDCCLFWAQADFAANLKPARPSTAHSATVPCLLQGDLQSSDALLRRPALRAWR